MSPTDIEGRTFMSKLIRSLYKNQNNHIKKIKNLNINNGNGNDNKNDDNNDNNNNNNNEMSKIRTVAVYGREFITTSPNITNDRYIYLYTFVCVYLYVHVCISVCVCVCVYINESICVYSIWSRNDNYESKYFKR
jgi:hypothetical protein